jgi:hypothetical protein
VLHEYELSTQRILTLFLNFYNMADEKLTIK